MKRLEALLLVLVLLCAPLGGAKESGDPATVKRAVRYAALGLLTVYTLQFDPTKSAMRLLFPSESGQLAPVREMEGCAAAEACINGSFFTDGNRPIGLLVSDGKVIQPVKNVSWGVFWVGRDGKAHIDRRKRFEEGVELKDVEFAVQSGPTVMWEGQVRTDLSAGLARRTSVGLTAEGKVVVLVFPWPISLAEMARFARDQVGVSTLMNLDGGGSTQLFVPGDAAMRVTGEPVAVGIGLYSR